MPIPNPNPSENRTDFIQRCMEDSLMVDEYDVQQRYAVCQSAWTETKAEDSYNDYPQAATNNAKKALKWAEQNGWGDCGTPVGKARANQLAKRENITRDTIARMASFKRHQQNKDVPYSEGCGGLMWDAWGGTEGIEWAIRKIQELKR